MLQAAGHRYSGGVAKLTAVYGPMFAGKTTWLLQRIQELENKNQKCLVFKPRLDDRYGFEAQLQTHNGMTGRARLIDEQDPHAILRTWENEGETHETVIIDEVIFFAPTIRETVKELLARGVAVVVAGLDTDYRRRPFGVMPQLIKIADERVELRSKCYKCSAEAKYSVRLAGVAGKIVVGASDKYQPACGKCHTVFEDEMLKNIVFPVRPSGRDNTERRIEIAADSMRVGKTTAVKVIAEQLMKRGYIVTQSFEDWQSNPYLKGSYSDPAKNFLESQKWFIKRKWQQIRDARGEISIQDVAPETDYCYAVTNLLLGRMSQEHFDEYDQFYRSLDWSQAQQPDLIVYLKVGDRELIKRAEASKREFEKVDSEYFLMMKKVNREWIRKFSNHKLSNSPIVFVDTNKLDFANEEKAKEELVKMVVERVDLI